MKKLRTVLMLIAGVLGTAAVPSAMAIPTATLTLKSGTSEVSIVDNGAGDLDLTEGQITFQGAVGAFSFTLSTGTSKPLQGSETQPFLTLRSTDITSVDAGTLEILFSDLFTGPAQGSLTSS